MQTPKTHKAIVYDKPGEISTQIVEVETLTPGPGFVRIQMWVDSLNLSLIWDLH